VGASAAPASALARPVRAAALLIVAAAALARIPGLFSDFWLDEVWSLLLSQEIDSPLGVFSELKHDNNHHLNTLVLYALGDRDQWIVYRLHALAAGIGGVWLAFAAARRIGALEAVLAAILCAGSYLLIQFSSEARGYTLSILFAFAAWIAADRFAIRPDSRRAAGLWLCTGLGFLSHLLFVHAFAAVGVWLWLRLRRENAALAPARFARAYAVPLGIAAGTWAWLVRGMMIGGGPDYVLGRVLLESWSYAAGGPASGPAAVAVAAAYVGLCAWGILRLRRAGRSEWSLLATASFLSPAALLLVDPPQVLFVRYFLLSVAFSYVAAAHALAEIARRSRAGRLLAGALVLAFLCGNAVHVADLAVRGRGGYREAVGYLAARTPEPTISVASDDDVANKMLLVYYQRFLPAGKRIRYVDRSERPARPPLWLIHHRIGAPGEVPARLRGEHGGIYALARSFPSSDLSGFHWLLYRRVAPEARGE
jgi:hypothetical protein